MTKKLNFGKSGLLEKALFGLKQAGKQWFYKISGFLKKFWLIQYNTDSYLFSKYENNNKLCLLLTLYVDDILIAGENTEITKVATKIKHKYIKSSIDKTAKENH